MLLMCCRHVVVRTLITIYGVILCLLLVVEAGSLLCIASWLARLSIVKLYEMMTGQSHRPEVELACSKSAAGGPLAKRQDNQYGICRLQSSKVFV
jgi:hypothetical protein